MQKEYNHLEIEKKWQDYWYGDNVFKSVIDNKKEKYYILDMFPYPSGAGLHVGHPEGYTATDILARYKRMKGFNVLHPMGWDAFGLPAENYAIKTGTHPRKTTEENIKTFKRQIKSIGFSYDWDREIDTTDPEYYKWTQWIFLKLFEKGLAYESFMPINWCPSCKTGLANEEVEGGICDRCKSKVEKKEMKQWMLKITEYAERLLNDLDTLEDWPEPIKEMQRNWIGKSKGLVFTAPVKDTKLTIQTFSAHFEACYADTFVVIAPDHPFLKELVKGTPDEQKVLDYAKNLIQKRLERGFEEEKESEGIFTGRYIVDPLGNGDLPIWVASFALADYGTGIVKCSAHDERDFAFAKKYGIKLKAVLLPPENNTLTKNKSVIFVHGWGSNNKSGFFGELEKLLKGNGYNVINNSFPNTNNPNYKTWYDLISKLIIQEKNKGNEITLLGHSTGGYIIQKIAEDYEVSRLIIVSPVAPVGEFSDNRTKLTKEWLGEGDIYKNYLLFHDAYIDAKKVVNNVKDIVFIFGKKDQYIDDKARKYFIDSYGDNAIVNIYDKYGHMGDSEGLNRINEIEDIFELNKSSGIDSNKLSTEQEKVKSFEYCYSDMQNGILTEPESLKGKKSGDCRQLVIDHCIEKGYAKEKVSYKLRDWVFSRQRYWGEPIPVIHCEKCGIVAVPENELPVRLPDVEKYEPTGTGESPLAGIDSWVNCKCPKCKGDAKRETNTMPQWAGSSWYYLKFMDAFEERNNCRDASQCASTNANVETFFKNVSTDKISCISPKSEKYWGPVDMYVGGAEHAVLHLLYSRFWHKVLFDLGYVSTIEPFKALRNQGMILAEDGQKMSKSLGNVINPDEVIKEYGADTLRLYEMFMGPFEQVKSWNTKSVLGVRRFLEKVWRLREKAEKPNKRVIIIHGFQGHKGEHWFPLVRKELILMGYYVQIPSMPNSYFPKYEEWKKVLDFLNPDENTILIGHSLGGGFITRYLNDTGKKVGNVILVAPTNNGKLLSEGKRNYDAFDKEFYLTLSDIDKNFIKNIDYKKLKTLSDFSLIYSNDEPLFEQLEFKEYADNLSSQSVCLKNAGHCSTDAKEKVYEEVIKLVSGFPPSREGQMEGLKDAELFRLLHKTIKKVGQQIEDFKFNTAISDMMVLVNKMGEYEKINANIYEDLLFMLSPFAPHICEELWVSMGHISSLVYKHWPHFEESLCIDSEITIVVQINGKIRGEFKASKDISKDDAILKAKEIVAKSLEGQSVKKEIYVAGKLVSLVV